jgi:hypothetical protein
VHHQIISHWQPIFLDSYPTSDKFVLNSAVFSWTNSLTSCVTFCTAGLFQTMSAPLITPEKKTPAPKPMTANIMTMIAIKVSKPILIPLLFLLTSCDVEKYFVICYGSGYLWYFFGADVYL